MAGDWTLEGNGPNQSVKYACHSYKQCIFNSSASLTTISDIIFVFFIFFHSYRSIIVSHCTYCDFSLHFPNGQCCWTFLYHDLSSLHSIFHNVIAQIFYPVLKIVLFWLSLESFKPYFSYNLFCQISDLQMCKSPQSSLSWDFVFLDIHLMLHLKSSFV